MKAAILAYTKQALKTACRAAAGSIATCTIYTIPRLFIEWEMTEHIPAVSIQVIPSDDEGFYGRLFHESDLLIFVSALGIAVRKIAPCIEDKKKDPAVLCLDEQGHYVISVLSGHIGGANAAARKLAGVLHAQAVITTATDVNHRFSVDAWAAEQGLYIDDMKAAKKVSAAILEQDVPMLCELPVMTAYPPGVKEYHGQEKDPAGAGIYIGCRRIRPFTVTLRLIPGIIHLGIGCRKGASCEQIEKSVNEVLKQHDIDLRAIRGVYSIDLKKEEQGLLQFCRLHGWDLTVYSADELLCVPGDFSSSGFVQSITGVDNVCERAAMKDARELLIRKTVVNGVTVAAASEYMELRFS